MRRRVSSTILLLTLAATLPITAPPLRGSTDRDIDLERLEDETVSLLQEYLRLDTTNPPGNESRAVEYLGAILEAEGIPYETAESAPGRANLWARLEGGSEPGLILLHHTDVVPADARYWDVPPFSGALVDGHLYGRGALDMKGLGILHLQAFLTLHRTERPLRRDVVFMATADEEAGGAYGAGWLVEERPEVLEGIGWLLTEGGSGTVQSGRTVFSVEVTQKVPLWLRLVARDVPGHGSTPRLTSSVGRLIRALARIEQYEFEPRVIPAVETYFEGLAELQSGPMATKLRHIRRAVKDDEFQDQLQLYNPRLHALIRNTCSLTVLEGSSKINVVPPEASAELDCRLLPDEDPDAVIRHLAGVIGDPMITIEKIMAFTPAVSTTDTELYRSIVEVSRRRFPDAVVLPAVVPGFTDSHFFRDLGIVSYGFTPMLIPAADARGIHGNNERISVESLKRSVGTFLDILHEVVY